MKLLVPPRKPVATIIATREEYLKVWLQDMASAGVTLEAGPEAWYWISPTGAPYLFVVPKIGEAAQSQEAA